MRTWWVVLLMACSGSGGASSTDTSTADPTSVLHSFAGNGSTVAIEDSDAGPIDAGDVEPPQAGSSAPPRAGNAAPGVDSGTPQTLDDAGPESAPDAGQDPFFVPERGMFVGAWSVDYAPIDCIEQVSVSSSLDCPMGATTCGTNSMLTVDALFHASGSPSWLGSATQSWQEDALSYSGETLSVFMSKPTYARVEIVLQLVSETSFVGREARTFYDGTGDLGTVCIVYIGEKQ